MKISVGVTTAPRKEDYLPRTLESLSSAGFDDVTVFAEPESSKAGGDNTVWREQTLGCLGNWKEALKHLASRDADYVLLCQDDVVFAKNIRSMLEKAGWPDNTGCLSLYCSSKYAAETGLLHVRSKDLWGALALMFPSEIARQIPRHQIARKWRSAKKCDMCTGRVMWAMGKPVRVVSPSFAQHIGDESTLCDVGAIGRRAASNFVGEQFDARDLLWADDVSQTWGKLSQHYAEITEASGV